MAANSGFAQGGLDIMNANLDKKTQSEINEFLPSMTISMQRQPSKFARLISLLIMLFVAITILWLFLSKVDIVVSAQGKVVPSGQIKTVQVAQQGVVKSILVKDGQFVEQGQPLIEMDATNTDADEKQLLNKLQKAQLTVDRLKVELGQKDEALFGEKILNSELVTTERSLLKANQVQFAEQNKQLRFERDQARATLEAARLEVSKLDSEIEFGQKQFDQKQRQAAEGLIPRNEVESAEMSLQSNRNEREVQLKRVGEASSRYESAKEKLQASLADYHSELYQQLAQSEHELQVVMQDMVKAEQIKGLQILRSPVDGVVQQLAVHTVGAVVTRADQLLVIIPEGATLEVEASVLNQDIGFVDTTQAVNVKVDAFEYTRYGMITGELDWVASDAVLDDKKGPVYPARIKLSSFSLPRKVNNREAHIQTGMNVTADIVIGQRRLIEYFSGPLLRYKDESLNER